MKTLLLSLFGAAVLSRALHAAPLEDAALQAKVDARIGEIKTWAAAPVIAAAVAAHNSSAPADHTAMTQEKWKSLTVLDPLVRSFNKNEAGLWLKTKKSEWVSEAFLSDATGRKVAFLSKPTNWSHAGNPKHEQPMAGTIWQGKVEVDESTGVQQVQVSVPVLVDGKPAGSLVVGLSLLKI